MTTKEFLQQGFVIQKMIRAKEMRIQQLRDMQTKLGGGFTEVHVQSSPRPDRFAELTAKLLDLITECEDDISRLLDVQREIGAIINTVESENCRLILLERYINHKSWEQIAADNNYSLRSVYSIHGHALLEAEKRLH